MRLHDPVRELVAKYQLRLNRTEVIVKSMIYA